MIRKKSRAFAASFVITLLAVCISTPLLSESLKESSHLMQEEILPGKLRMMPVPNDFRNYFVFQSIGSSSAVLIGDFSGADKILSLATDDTQDGKHDRVTEYLPDAKKTSTPSKPTTSFYTDFPATREAIINGDIFKASYSYNMQSLPTLYARIKTGKDIKEWKFGWNVKIYDPDNPSTIQAQFFFSRKDGLYTLIFETNYYKLYKTRINPPIRYSVYCRDSKDPKVIEVVDALYKTMNAR